MLISLNQNLRAELKYLECLGFPPGLGDLVFWYSTVLPPWPPGQRLRLRDVHVKLFAIFDGDKLVNPCIWDPERSLSLGTHLAEVALPDSKGPWVTTTDTGITGTYHMGPILPIQEFKLDWMRAVHAWGHALKYVKDQTPDLCLKAVNQDGRALRLVKEQTTEICLAAVKQNGKALRCVKRQTPQICLAAVRQNGRALIYVREQTTEICLEAVKQNGMALQFVILRTPEICHAAIRQNGLAIIYQTTSV